MFKLYTHTDTIELEKMNVFLKQMFKLFAFFVNTHLTMICYRMKNRIGHRNSLAQFYHSGMVHYLAARALLERMNVFEAVV